MLTSNRSEMSEICITVREGSRVFPRFACKTECFCYEKGMLYEFISLCWKLFQLHSFSTVLALIFYFSYWFIVPQWVSWNFGPWKRIRCLQNLSCWFPGCPWTIRLKCSFHRLIISFFWKYSCFWMKSKHLVIYIVWYLS